MPVQFNWLSILSCKPQHGHHRTASRKKPLTVDKILFMELFQVARKKTMTERTCRGAIRKAGIYPFDPTCTAVLGDSLKEIEKGRLTEPSDGDSASSRATPAADTTFTPKQTKGPSTY